MDDNSIRYAVVIKLLDGFDKVFAVFAVHEQFGDFLAALVVSWPNVSLSLLLLPAGLECIFRIGKFVFRFDLLGFLHPYLTLLGRKFPPCMANNLGQDTVIRFDALQLTTLDHSCPKEDERI
jgi:hypothetical protein